MKRKDYIDWDTAFLTIAIAMSYRCKDPRTQNGAVIIDHLNRIISTGYNGFPRGCSDDKFPWTSPDKYDYVIHAEANAILNAHKDLTGCKMYLYSERGYYPCSGCATMIVQSGIKEVVMAFATKDEESVGGKYMWEPTKKMFEAAHIKINIIEGSSLKVENIINKLQKTKDIIANEENPPCVTDCHGRCFPLCD